MPRLGCGRRLGGDRRRVWRRGGRVGSSSGDRRSTIHRVRGWPARAHHRSRPCRRAVSGCRRRTAYRRRESSARLPPAATRAPHAPPARGFRQRSPANRLRATASAAGRPDRFRQKKTRRRPAARGTAPAGISGWSGCAPAGRRTVPGTERLAVKLPDHSSVSPAEDWAANS